MPRPDIQLPPRRVGLNLTLSLIFENFFTLFGSFFFGFGMIFVWAFGLNADLSGLQFAGRVETCPGVAVNWDRTGFSESSDDTSDGRQVFFTDYAFFDAEGNRRTGRSYATGTFIEQGREMTVEYPAGRPEYSRIRGMRRKAFGPFVLFVFIFPAVGLYMIWHGLKQGLKQARLLKIAEPAEARIIACDGTSVYVNERQVQRYVFAFKPFGSREEFRAEFRTHLTDHLGDEPTELVLFDSADPGIAVPVDGLSAPVKFCTDGSVRCAKLWRGWAGPALFTVCFVPHGVYLLWRFFFLEQP
ncbi:MAG: hypothetical protein PHQ23_17180 [Candidatus Wallbacteria bacterium]|nr:hypothetical protein [Candidatus Wallbacteria bacterium]